MFFTAIYLALAALLGKHHYGADLTLANTVFNLSFLSPFATLVGNNAVRSLDILPGTWSLNAEIWFYLAMPALACFLTRVPAKWAILITLSVLPIAYRHALGIDSSFIARFSLPGVADAFLLGMAVAAFSANGWIGKWAGLLFPIGAVWYLGVCASILNIKIDHAYQLAAASAMMIAGLTANGDWPWKRWLSATPIVRIGHMSFSIFLCNILVAWYIVLPLAQAVGIESTEGRFAMNMLIGIPLIFLIGWAGYRWVETPFLVREPLPFRQTAYHGIALAAIVVGSSVLPSCAAYVVRDGLGVEYVGIVPRITSVLAPHAVVGARFNKLLVDGKPAIDSESKRAAISIKHTFSNEIHISSAGVTTGDRWVAVMLPIDTKDIARGYLYYLKAAAELFAEPNSPMQICLGIFNGKDDTCSRLVQGTGEELLDVKSLINNNEPIQFKLNIFPNGYDGPFDIRLQGLRAYQLKP